MASTATEQQQPPTTQSPQPRLNIAILAYGTRGDAQPYVRIAQELISHGHRVRVTSPPSLQSWVRDEYGIETWSLGQDMGQFIRWAMQKPTKKMLTMVNGEYRQLVKNQMEILIEHWRACVDGGEVKEGERPFVADVIIASPPGMAHVHVAQKLGIPVFFTHFNPKTPTRHWPHGESYPSDNVFKPCDENRDTWIKSDSK